MKYRTHIGLIHNPAEQHTCSNLKLVRRVTFFVHTKNRIIFSFSSALFGMFAASVPHNNCSHVAGHSEEQQQRIPTKSSTWH